MIKLSVLALVLSTSVVLAGKAEVSAACEGDYMAHCSNFEPYSAPCRACMRSAGLRKALSAGCLRALNANGMISSSDKRKYYGKKRKLLSQQ